MVEFIFLPGFWANLGCRCIGKLVTMREWQNTNDFWTSTASLALSPCPRSKASSVILWPWSSLSAAAEKNALWRLRTSLPHLLRQASTACPRPLLWRQTRLPRVFHPQSPVCRVRRRETRRVGLAGRQSAVHQAVCLLRWSPLPPKH